MAQRIPKLVAYAVRGIVSVFILAIGLVLFDVLVQTAPQVTRSDAADTAPRVEWYELARISVPRRWSGYGTAVAQDQANISVEVSAIVTAVGDGTDVGLPVHRGQVLATLDAGDFEINAQIARQNIARLQAQLDNLDVEQDSWREQLALALEETEIARSEYERAKDAVERGGGTQIEIDRRRRDLNVARRAQAQIKKSFDRIEPRRQELTALKHLNESQLEAEQRNIERCTIRSPIEGVMQSWDLEVGERATPGPVIAAIVDTRRIEVPLRFAISALDSIQPGDTVITHTESHAWSWTGQITRIAPASETSTRSIIAYAEVQASESSGPRLVPGQFVQAEVISDEQLLLALPRRAVLDASVLVSVDSRVQQRSVDVLFHANGELGGTAMLDREWAILADSSQVAPGDHIVLSNVGQLRPGSLIVEAEQLGNTVASRDPSDQVPVTAGSDGP